MKVVILAGGYGTRIRDVTSDIPKPMISIGDRPILWHIMNQYSRHGFKDFVLSLGYKSEIVKDYFVNYTQRQSDFTLNLNTHNIIKHNNNIVEDWNITFAETGLNALTGARIFRVKQYIEKDDCFMVSYGDGVSNVDITKLVAFHKSHGKLMTVTGARPPGRFGELEIQNNEVVGFNEKPQTTEGWISSGFFVCNKKVLDYITAEEDLTFEKEPIENIVKDGQLMVYKHEGFWHPMDTSRDYKLLNQLWDEGSAPWK